MIGACDCGRPNTAGNSRLCSRTCSHRTRTARYRANKTRKELEEKLAAPLLVNERQIERLTRSALRKKTGGAPVRVRRGPGYEKFVADGWPARLESGSLTGAEVAELLDTSKANVSGWMAAWDIEQEQRAQTEAWVQSDEGLRALDDFEYFRGRYFTDDQDRPYVTTAYHRRWIVGTIRAMEVGGRLVILSPPRFGKTELLIHFCVWLILRNPNVRIMWIGLNEDIAGQSLDLVRDILENNERLKADFLPPGESFKPEPRSGRPWSTKKFVVATRSRSLKSPTMIAIGKGGKLLSRDADLVIGDDLVDHDAVRSPSSREDDVSWTNTQLGSRKEAHTAIMFIGSRQHHYDLWGRLIKNPAWASIVESAHNRDCTLPRHEDPLPSDHDEERGGCAVCNAHRACLLWPEKRTFAWLESQRAAMDDDEHFEMVYLNKTRPAGALHLTEEQIKACFDVVRVVGTYPVGTRLIAGLDPASAGDQVAFLWAYHPVEQRRYMVDLDLERAGGLPGANRVIRQWAEQYPDLKVWVVERNGYQQAILQDREVVRFCSENGISLRPSFTSGHNKWDPEFGVTKQFSVFKALGPVTDERTGLPTGEIRPRIDLPYGDAASKAKTHLYRDQLLDFEGASKKTKTDVVMAAWLPETVIRTWRMEQRREAEADYAQTQYPVATLGGVYRRVG